MPRTQHSLRGQHHTRARAATTATCLGCESVRAHLPQACGSICPSEQTSHPTRTYVALGSSVLCSSEPGDDVNHQARGITPSTPPRQWIRPAHGAGAVGARTAVRAHRGQPRRDGTRTAADGAESSRPPCSALGSQRLRSDASQLAGSPGGRAGHGRRARRASLARLRAAGKSERAERPGGSRGASARWERAAVGTELLPTWTISWRMQRPSPTVWRRWRGCCGAMGHPRVEGKSYLPSERHRL